MYGGSKSEKEFIVRGRPALVIILILVLLGAAYRIYLHRNLQIAPKARESIASSITAKLYRDLLAKGDGIEKTISDGGRETVEELGREIAGTKVKIHNMAMRGRGDQIIVKANYSIHRPDDVENKVGYFKCSHSFLTGWNCEYEVSIWLWYIELF